jgi:rhodanese-related sulfurtransferase
MLTITAQEVKQRLDAGENLHIVDENAEFNIGGLLLPLGKVQTMQVEDIEDWKEEEVIVYCRSGNRSGQACLILETLGFKNVKNLSGGMLNWKETFK